MHQIEPLFVWFSNFLSYGNNLTKINLRFTKPTLILGRNLDSSTEGLIDSNGAGKSVIINAISYASYGKTIGNKIKLNNLINNINEKNMLVGFSFCKTIGNIKEYYSIERWRKNKSRGGDGVKILKSNNADFDNAIDITNDSISRADKQIVEIIGHSFDIFSRIVLYSSSHTLFFDLPPTSASELSRSDILEELFNLTELSTKAEILKQKIKVNKEELSLLTKLDEQISLEINRHNSQLDIITKECNEWDSQKNNKIQLLNERISTLSDIDFNFEISNLKKLKELEDKQIIISNSILINKKDVELYATTVKNHDNWVIENKAKIEKITEDLNNLKDIDIEEQLSLISEISSIKSNIEKLTNDLEFHMNDKSTLEFNIQDLTKEITSLSNNICPYCSQTFIEAKNKLESKQHICNEYKDKIDLLLSEIERINDQIPELVKELNTLTPKLKLKTLNDVQITTFRIESWSNELINLQNSSNPYDISSINIKEIENKLSELQSELDTILENIIKYKSILTFSSERELNLAEADLNNSIEKLNEIKNSDNPHLNLKNNLDRIILPENKTQEIQKLNDLIKHQEFLYKLLTSKNSFIRKVLLTKNIQYLNERFQYYLRKIGLPHKVQFDHDMSTSISQFGKTIEYENLSTGQKARIHIALSFAFRDILQKLHGKISFCILDECLDNGLSNVGVQLTVKMIKDIAKEDNLSIFVISHRDEVHSMFDSRLEIELENKFSNIVKCDV